MRQLLFTFALCILFFMGSAQAQITQCDGPDNLIIFEAEDYDLSVAGNANDATGPYEWTLVTAPAGFSGTGAMQGLPNDTHHQTGNVEADILVGPRLDYEIDFAQAGTYYVHVRGNCANADDDSIHIGLDGAVLEIWVGMPVGGYSWTTDVRAITVETAGVHTLNIFMRENGTLMDKLLLTTTENFADPENAICEGASEGEGEGEGEEPTVADPLKVDFGRPGDAVQDGFQAYTAEHEQAGTFTAQDFTALGTAITVTPTWASDAVPAVMQMIHDRPNNTDATALTDDWIGVDGREAGSPLTLNISGLPAGNYYWLSYHHDEDNQGTPFNATVHDAWGTHPTVSVNQTSGSEGVTTLAAVAKFEAFITSDGSSEVKVDFDATGNQWFNFVAVNGIEIHELAEGSSMGSSVNPQFVAEGGTVTLTAPTGTAYRWVMDGVMIAGATDSELTLGPLGADDTGSYWALYEGAGGYFIKTKKLYMTVNAPGVIPIAGGLGIVALMGGCALAGAGILRRRRK